MSEFRRATLAAVLVVAVAEAVGAQDIPKAAPPQIVTSGTGEVRVPPDLATVTIGVQVRATSAEEASAGNRRKQQAVVNAIRATGVSPEQITTTGFAVQPELKYDKPGSPPVVAGYLVSNSVTVRLARLDMAGTVIDASIAAGANEVNSLSFSISNPDSARRLAIGAAVARAKGDAEVAARAAGGLLGALLELTIGDAELPVPRPMAFAARMQGAVDTPVEPGLEAVRATVSGRWQFLPSPR